MPTEARLHHERQPPAVEERDEEAVAGEMLIDGHSAHTGRAG
jgi:hypothetical protein